MNKKASDIKESMSKKKKSVKETIEEYKTINLKLNNGLDVSLNIIVDLSKMLKHYHDLLNAIQTFVDEPIDLADDVKDLAAKAYGKLTSTFNEQIDDVISAYDSDSEEIGKLQSIKSKINRALEDNIEEDEEEEEEKIKFSKKKKKDEGLKFT
jgi:CDP-glycerol glycerophosphotransferase (TagB/SpsB family)